MTPTHVVYVISSVLALAGLYLGILAWRRATTPIAAGQTRKPYWLSAILGSISIVAFAAVVVVGPVGILRAPLDFGLSVLTVVLVVAALSLTVFAVLGISAASLDRNTSSPFTAVVRLLSGAFLAAITALLVSGPAGWWPANNPWTLEAIFQSNFELALIVVGVGVVILTAWSNRAWANATNDLTLLTTRQKSASDYSLVFACAVGVAVLVTIGASAFAARLAQQDIDALRGEDSHIARQRVQDAVFRIDLLDRRLSALNTALEELTIQRAATPDAQIQATQVQLQFYADIAMVVVRTEAITGEEVPGNTLTSFEAISAALIRAVRTELRTHTADPQTVSVLTELDRVALVRQRALDLTYEARGIVESEALFNTEIARIEDAKTCEVRRLAWQITESRDQEGQTPDERRTELQRRADNACADPNMTDQAEALTLLGAAQPLARSGMSYWLARRAPVTLSFELVLVLGALGALMRAISPLLRRMLRVGTSADGAPGAEAATDAEIAAAPGGLVELALQLVFGMATALALFVLVNVAIGASSLSQQAQALAGDHLSPFAMAALGLLGGYAGLNVADWMGSLTTQLLQARRTAEEQPTQQIGEGGENTQGGPGVG